MIRPVLVFMPLPALLFFPAPLFMAFAFFASLAFPPAGVLYGLLSDALYYSPGAARLPMGFVYGTGITVAGFLIARFFASRVAGFSSR